MVTEEEYTNNANNIISYLDKHGIPNEISDLMYKHLEYSNEIVLNVEDKIKGMSNLLKQLRDEIVLGNICAERADFYFDEIKEYI